MEQQQLQELLTKLHAELEHVETVDESTVAVLAQLREDIQKLVHEGDAHIKEPEPVSERLGEALKHFETDHPRLSLAIQHVLESPARMGN